MRRISMVLVSVLILGVVALPVLAGETAKGKEHDLTVEFVSFDKDAMTLTILDDEGMEKTVPMKKGAVKGLEGLESGQKIVVTCLDDESGQHQAVVKVKAAKEKQS